MRGASRVCSLRVLGSLAYYISTCGTCLSWSSWPRVGLICWLALVRIPQRSVLLDAGCVRALVPCPPPPPFFATRVHEPPQQDAGNQRGRPRGFRSAGGPASQGSGNARRHQRPHQVCVCVCHLWIGGTSSLDLLVVLLEVRVWISGWGAIFLRLLHAKESNKFYQKTKQSLRPFSASMYLTATRWLVHVLFLSIPSSLFPSSLPGTTRRGQMRQRLGACGCGLSRTRRGFRT